jgi:hypothetical protein
MIWEYTTLLVRFNDKAKEWRTEVDGTEYTRLTGLQIMGGQGWELVSVIHDQILVADPDKRGGWVWPPQRLYFKRPKTG